MRKHLLTFFACVFGAFSLCAQGVSIAADNWQVGLTPAGFRISKGGVLLSSGSECSIAVKQPKWTQLIGRKEMAKAVKEGRGIVTTARSITLQLSNGDVSCTMKAEILNANSMRISYEPLLGSIPVADSSIWFLGLPQEDFCEGTVIFYDKTEAKLPVTAAKDSEKKSKWRLCANTRDLNIKSKKGILHLNGSYFYLFDARFHQGFAPELRTICVRSVLVPSGGKAEIVLQYRQHPAKK